MFQLLAFSFDLYKTLCSMLFLVLIPHLDRPTFLWITPGFE